MNNSNNRYINGISADIPDEFAEDFLKEYEKINNDGNNPLLMYILMKNAQSGFDNGPIGSDSYYETFDPNMNKKLRPDFIQFLETYYPDVDNKSYNFINEIDY